MARSPKSLTRAQLASRKAQAVRFTRDVVGDSDRAAEIEAESLEDYASRRHIQLTNPHWRWNMARKSISDYREDLRDARSQIRDLQAENESLQDQLDSISDIVAPEEDEEEEEDADTAEADEGEEEGDEEEGDADQD